MLLYVILAPMLMMKATQGTTFNYDASYWTTDNTLNPWQTDTDDEDAKFDVMNKFAAKDMMAIWPDISNGGSIPASDRGWRGPFLYAIHRSQLKSR